MAQCKEAIVSGTYPTQRNEAKDLGALIVKTKKKKNEREKITGFVSFQCQIEQQDFNSSRHKPGSLKVILFFKKAKKPNLVFLAAS